MKDFYLRGPLAISLDIFRLLPENSPAWSKLEFVYLTFNVCTPDGKWYFTRDPSTDRDDRTYPNTGKILPLLESFAVAIARIPILKRAVLYAEVYPSNFKVEFMRGGKANYLEEDEEGTDLELARRKFILKKKSMLTFQTGRWRGEEDRSKFAEILDKFKTAAKNELLVEFRNDE